MCRLNIERIIGVSDEQVLRDVRMVLGDPNYQPSDPKLLCNLIFTTCYMGSVNSSKETENRAHELASQIGRCVVDKKS